MTPSAVGVQRLEVLVAVMLARAACTSRCRGRRLHGARCGARDAAIGIARDGRGRGGGARARLRDSEALGVSPRCRCTCIPAVRCLVLTAPICCVGGGSGACYSSETVGEGWCPASALGAPVGKTPDRVSIIPGRPSVDTWALNRPIIGRRWEHTARLLGLSCLCAGPKPDPGSRGRMAQLAFARLGPQGEPAGGPARARWDFEGRLILPPELGPELEGPRPLQRDRQRARV